MVGIGKSSKEVCLGNGKEKGVQDMEDGSNALVKASEGRLEVSLVEITVLKDTRQESVLAEQIESSHRRRDNGYKLVTLYTRKIPKNKLTIRDC